MHRGNETTWKSFLSIKWVDTHEGGRDTICNSISRHHLCHHQHQYHHPLVIKWLSHSSSSSFSLAFVEPACPRLLALHKEEHLYGPFDFMRMRANHSCSHSCSTSRSICYNNNMSFQVPFRYAFWFRGEKARVKVVENEHSKIMGSPKRIHSGLLSPLFWHTSSVEEAV